MDIRDARRIASGIIARGGQLTLPVGVETMPVSVMFSNRMELLARISDAIQYPRDPACHACNGSGWVNQHPWRELRRGDTMAKCKSCCYHDQGGAPLTEVFAGYREGFETRACSRCGVIVAERQILG